MDGRPFSRVTRRSANPVPAMHSSAPFTLTAGARPRSGEISTKSAQHEMILPSLLAIIIPIVVGMVLGVAGVLGLLLLAAGKGTPIVVRTEGVDEAEAMVALTDLVDRRFDESE